MSKLQALNVTWEDLAGFHQRHFHTPAPGERDNSVAASQQVYDDKTEDEIFEDLNGLGFYPDGSKRTIRDDQIAMFRHSEIYAAVRAQELEREQAYLDGLDSGTRAENTSLQNTARADDDTKLKLPALSGHERDQAKSSRLERAPKDVPSRSSENRFTERRLARELDDAVQTEGDAVVELDY